ncbi:transposase [Micromonospora sp. TSRI0369]|nr:transposase [Micromonospora sp. TSRI0369]
MDEGRRRRLADALEQGPAAHGFGSDQRWTLARVSDLIARMFRTRYTLRGTANIMYRLGWSVQVPKHRAVERDEAAITTWRRETWPAGKR